MKKCVDCGKEIDDYVEYCPRCYAKQEQEYKSKYTFSQLVEFVKEYKVIVLVSLFVVLCIGYAAYDRVVGGDNNEKKVSETSEKDNNDEYETEDADESEEEVKETPSPKEKKKSYISKCKTYDYKSIMRKPSKYEGKKIKVSGKVFQVQEEWFDGVTLLVRDKNDNIWYANYTYGDNDDKILEDDTITVYGESTGTEQYETTLGSGNIVCSVDAKYVKVK